MIDELIGQLAIYFIVFVVCWIVFGFFFGALFFYALLSIIPPFGFAENFNMEFIKQVSSTTDLIATIVQYSISVFVVVIILILRRPGRRAKGLVK